MLKVIKQAGSDTMVEPTDELVAGISRSSRGSGVISFFTCCDVPCQYAIHKMHICANNPDDLNDPNNFNNPNSPNNPDDLLTSITLISLITLITLITLL